MKFSSISAFLAVASTAVFAAPADKPLEARQSSTLATFYGAAGAEFSQYFYPNGESNQIYNPLSVSRICTTGTNSCVFYGVDGVEVTVVGYQCQDVGPPQTLTRGVCNIE